MESQQLTDDQSTRIKAVLDYWFGEGADRDGKVPDENFKKWFMFSEENDKFMKDKF